MSYTPTTWVTGDPITATKLNKLENGVANAGSAMIVTSSYVGGVETMNKTVQEIYDALVEGTPVYYKWTDGALGTDYESWTSVAPITYIYTYQYTDTIRVAVNRPVTAGNISNKYSVLAPAVAIFQATGVNQYPAYYCSVFPTNYSAG